MSTKLNNLVTGQYILLARSFIAIIGCIGVWWGIVGFPVFWRESSTGRIADRIIAGDPFKTEILARQLPIIDIIDSIQRAAYCRPGSLRSAAIIQLRMVEVFASANAGKPRNERLESLGDVIRSSLSCSPADPFLWLALFWVTNTQNGAKADYLKYLQMSYQLGQNEGWIGSKRNRLAFSEFEQLPADLAESAISEFVGLVESGFTQQAAEIFIGSSRGARDAVLTRLNFLPDRYREQFLAELSRLDYDGDQQTILRSEPRKR
jgi:hypothetical protein